MALYRRAASLALLLPPACPSLNRLFCNTIFFFITYITIRICRFHPSDAEGKKFLRTSYQNRSQNHILLSAL